MKTRFRSPLPIPEGNYLGKHGWVLQPGASLDLDLSVPKRSCPMRYSLHFVAEQDLFGKLMVGDGWLLKQTYHRIDDTLEPGADRGAVEPYVLHLRGQGEDWPREAWIRVDPSSLLKRNRLSFRVEVLTRNVRYARGGQLGIELGIYWARKGRHCEDVSQAPDETIFLRVPAGSARWKSFSVPVSLPSKAVMLVVRVGGRNFFGEAWFGSPRLFAPAGESVIPPLAPHQLPTWNTSWTGINLSRKEWPRFSMAVDGRAFFRRTVYFPGDHWYDFDVPVCALSPGRHRLTIRLDRDYPDRLPIKLRSVELLEESHRPMEVVWHPEHVSEGGRFPVLLERNTSRGSELIVRQIEAGCARPHPEYPLEMGDGSTRLRLRRVVRSSAESIHVGAGDIYCMAQTREDFLKYLVWYLENQQGNGIFFRSMYYANGTRRFDPEAWRTLIALVNQLGLTYHYIEDGRSLNDLEINPPEALLWGPGYHGRQQHERDGHLYGGRYRVGDAFEYDLARRFQLNCRRSLPLARRTDGTAYIQDMRKVDDARTAERRWLKVLTAYRESRGVTRHTGPSALSRYFLKAGYEWVGAEQMYGPEEITLASLRGASRAYGKNAFGTHLAHQWSSSPHDTPNHAHRFFLSLATSYMQGATEIDTEDGLWRISYGYDRFSQGCRIHQQVQRDFLAFVQTHPRRGAPRVPIAVLQGRHCGWMCYGRRAIWGSERPEFSFGPPEESFDLLRVFYPRSVLDALSADYRHDRRKSNGWYSGMPYGPVDLLPIEAPSSVLRDYRSVAFLGWNTYCDGDFQRLSHFVRAGGTLLLARPHVSRTVRRGAALDFPGSPMLDELLGTGWRRTSGRRARNIGAGRILFHGHDGYPADRRIRSAYEADLRRIGEETRSRERESGWVKGAADVSFTAYDWSDGRLRTLYLLMIDWWSGKEKAVATLLFGRGETPLIVRKGRIEIVTLSKNLAVQVDTPDADVLDIREERQQAVVTVQSDRGASLRVYRRDASGYPSALRVSRGGVQQLTIDLRRKDRA